MSNRKNSRSRRQLESWTMKYHRCHLRGCQKVSQLSQDLHNSQRNACTSTHQPLSGCFLTFFLLFLLLKLKPAHVVKGLQKRMDPLIITKYPPDNATPSSDDLHGYPDQSIEKPAELHCQKLIPMFPFVHQQSKPSLKSPCQGCHDHIRPVG